MAGDSSELMKSVREIRLAFRTLVRELGYLNKHLAGTELSPSQVHALLEIERFPKTQASELTDLFRLDKSAVSRLLADLNQRGFITTATSAKDARGRVLRLTDKGRRTLKGIHKKADLQFRNTLCAIEGPKQQIVVKSLTLFARALSTTRRKADSTPSSQT